MAITSQYTDTTEPVSDVDAEAATNQHLYGVISGCSVTYDASDMTYDVAAGTILHNGSVVSVSAQANAGTLTADGTNPRWATIYLDSSGTEGLVSGTAAADPSKPETGDNVAIAMVLIEAGQTVANNIATKLDKRVWTHAPGDAMYKDKTSTEAQTWNNDTELDPITAVSGTFSFSGEAGAAYFIEAELNLSAVNNSVLQLALTNTGGSGSATRFQQSTLYDASAGAVLGARGTTLGTGITAALSLGGAGASIVTRYSAFILVNAAGTFTLEAANGVASATNTTINGGWFKVTKVTAAI